MANKVELYNNGTLIGTDNAPIVSGGNWTYSIPYTAEGTLSGSSTASYRFIAYGAGLIAEHNALKPVVEP